VDFLFFFLFYKKVKHHFKCKEEREGNEKNDEKYFKFFGIVELSTGTNCFWNDYLFFPDNENAVI